MRSENEKLTPDPGLPLPIVDSVEWLRQLVDRLQDIIRNTTRRVNHLLDGFMLGVSALPTATSQHRGRMIVLEGAAGVIDKLYWCRKTAGDTYEWKEIV